MNFICQEISGIYTLILLDFFSFNYIICKAHYFSQKYAKTIIKIF